MSKKIARTGESVFFSEYRSDSIKKAVDKSFEVTEDFSLLPYGVEFNQSASLLKTNEGLKTTSNISDLTLSKIKIYVARYRKFSCDWDSVLYYGVLHEHENININEWEFLYVNDKYVAYQIYSETYPKTFPFNGDIPPQSVAPFIRYESFKNIYIRKECKFRYKIPILEFVSDQGDDEWKLVTSTDDECEFRYVKSTPYGCDLSTPDINDIVLTEDCGCVEVSSSSSSSMSSSDSSVFIKSSDSLSSTESSESSSLNSSSSEDRRSPKNVTYVYLRIIGKPFTENQYKLELVNPLSDPLIWSANSHNLNTLTTGDISLTMNNSGRFLLSANIVVDGNKIIIENAVLSNILNENFASLNTYLKGIAPIESPYITMKYDGIDHYDCVFSYESMTKAGGANKKISEIIYDYEMNEMTIDREADNIVLYLNRANFDIDDKANDVCRAWGLFILTNIGNGVWSYGSGNQSVTVTQSIGGNWNINRKYIISSNNNEEIDIPIKFQDITNNSVANYNGFIGLSVTNMANINGGVAKSSVSDICNDINTLIVMYSMENYAISDYTPFNGDLLLTLDGGSWNGKTSYTLYQKSINSNLTVWNWSSSSSGGHEYAILFTPDGILWKLNVGKSASSTRSSLYSEFIYDSHTNESFGTFVGKIAKSLVNINGDWSDSDMSFVISESKG